MLEIHKADDRKEIKKHIGNWYQVAGTRHYTLSDGSNFGTKSIDVKTGSGFEYTIVKDRGLDISLASYKGVNLVFLTANAETHPSFSNPWGNEWLRTFFGGLLTTCGPTYLGPPCTDNGESLGLHGRYSSIPARNVCDLTSLEQGEITVSGTVADNSVFGHKITIQRSIRSTLGDSCVVIEDTVRNEGSKEAPLTMLYHINLGYPLVCEESSIHVQFKEYAAYNEYSQKHIGSIFDIARPSGENQEKNYLYHLDDNKDSVTACIWNRNLMGGIALYIRFNPKELPFLTQWKLEDEMDYVVALEPSNTACESRNVLRQRGTLPMLQPKEEKKFRVEIGVVEGNREIEKMMNDL